MSATEIARQQALAQIAKRGYATVCDVVEETALPRRQVWDALLGWEPVERRMDYARKSGAKRFIFERRSGA